MASLADHTSSSLIKILYIGDSSTGKTGSLVSLVKAGYKIYMIDCDAGVGTLKAYIKRECPELLGNVDVEPCRDKFKNSPAGPVIDGLPKAFVRGLDLMNKWSDGSAPQEWGEKCIFVLDSLSAYGKAAFAWAKGMNPGAKDPRQWYFAAQEAIEKVITMLTSEAFATNVIVISHVNYKEVMEGVTKGYANAIGTALGPVLPRYFNTLVLAETEGFGKSTSRKIKTMPTGIIDLKTPVSFDIEASLPLATGMADLFAKIKANQ